MYDLIASDLSIRCSTMYGINTLFVRYSSIIYDVITHPISHSTMYGMIDSNLSIRYSTMYHIINPSARSSAI